MMLTSMPAQDHLSDRGPSEPVTPHSDERSHAWYFSTVPAQEIVPIVDDRFQSSIQGIYVIGDVTGLPLVKVAANQGVQVIAAMQKLGEFSRSGDLEGLDLVIIGGGPAGLSAAAEAEKLGIRYVVLERDRLASTIRSFPRVKWCMPSPSSSRTPVSLMSLKTSTKMNSCLEFQPLCNKSN